MHVGMYEVAGCVGRGEWGWRAAGGCICSGMSYTAFELGVLPSLLLKLLPLLYGSEFTDVQGARAKVQ